MFKMVAFDLDGTIADTIPLCVEAFRKSVSPYAGHELSEQEIVQTFGLNEIGMIKAFVPQKWEVALQDFYCEYTLLHRKVTKPFPGILELLTVLKNQNIILALVTGKGEKSCQISLKELRLEHMFDAICYGSEKAPNKRENIECLLKEYAISRNQFGYVGDAVSDIRACREAGVTCFSAAWQDSSDIALLEKENPGRVCCNVENLCQFLGRDNFLHYHEITEEEKEEISRWRYDGEYAIYNLPSYEEMKQQNCGLANPKNHFFSFYEKQCLVGYVNLCPEGKEVFFGIGVKPECCGQGYGQKMTALAGILSKILFPGKSMYLEVRTWNQRAIQCYKKVGFVVQGQEFSQTTGAGEGRFYRMVKKAATAIDNTENPILQ